MLANRIAQLRIPRRSLVESVFISATKDDPDENDDLAKTHLDVVERLKKKIDAWHPVKTTLR